MGVENDSGEVGSVVVRGEFKTSRLTIGTTPEGWATVALNGEEVKNCTGLSLRVEPGGRHRLVLELDVRFVDVDLPVEGETTYRPSVEFPLQPTRATP